jgi:hypothetical protein
MPRLMEENKYLHLIDWAAASSTVASVSHRQFEKISTAHPPGADA